MMPEISVSNHHRSEIKKYGIILLKIKKTPTCKKIYLFGFILLLSIEKIIE
jgi:hypothetical protein